MSPEFRRVSEGKPQQSLGSLSACLVDGDGEQWAREWRVRRRALALSILLQSAVLATLILVPLSGKAECISLTIVTTVVQYGHPRKHPRGNARTTTSRPPMRDSRFTFHPPTNRANPHPVEEANPVGPHVEFDPKGNARNDGPDCSGCISIGGRETGPRPPQPPVETPTRPRHIKTQLDPAMLIHRVGPVYPPLARQTRREGRVELRALLGTDSTIPSLHILSIVP